MKRRLILLRHAKAAPEEADGGDWARPLNARGRAAAPVIGQRLGELGWVPEQVLSSDSARTTETWDGLGLEAPIRFTNALYHAGFLALREQLDVLDEGVGTAMAIGHNPGWEQSVEFLSGRYTRMTTCNAALLEGAGATWAEAMRAPWTLFDILRPRPPRT